MSLDSLRRLRRSGGRPDCVTVIVGRLPVWMDDADPGLVVIEQDPAALDLRPLIGLTAHLIDISGDTDLLLAVMTATEEAGIKPLGACSAHGSCGVSPEHELAMTRYRESLRV